MNNYTRMNNSYRLMSGGSLSGSFRLTCREMSSIQVMRGKMNMSINHIATTMRRSTATIQGYLKIAGMVGMIDNRGKTQTQHQNRILAFQNRVGKIRAAFNLYKNGKAGTFLEALQMTIRGFGRVPPQEEYTTGQTNGTKKGTLQDSGDGQEANENSTTEEEEEPA